MKKINFLFFSLLAVVALSISFVSCSKDDDGGDKYSTLIIGKWVPLPEDKDPKFDSMEFFKGGSMNFSLEGHVMPATWSISGDKLTITLAGKGATVYTIVELTETTFKFQSPNEDVPRELIRA